MTPGSPPPPPGLQAERTELAWVRTALSGAGLALAAARVGPDPVSFTLALVTGAAVIALGFAACLLRTRSLASRSRPIAPGPVAVGLLAASVALAEVVTLALLLR
jgi:uncharacterized membrane protein YidH (DUF202 family)